ncbi:hypothetical protein NQ318_005719, partial [Aromia moschata]
VQESVEGILIAGGMTDAVNWLKRKEHQLTLEKNSICCQTSDTVLIEANKGSGDGDKKELARRKSCSSASEGDVLKKRLNEVVRGHWCSLAMVFKCGKCHQLITPAVASNIPCIPTCMRLQPDGSIVSLHIRDPTWNINDHIAKLHRTLRSWRRVYWRLWGNCHFLYCVTCRRFFPPEPDRVVSVSPRHAAVLHPGRPEGPLAHRQVPLLRGAGLQVPVAGEPVRLPVQATRVYDFVKVCTQDVRDSAVFTLLETYQHLIEEEPPELLFPEKLTRLVAREPLWWT